MNGRAAEGAMLGHALAESPELLEAVVEHMPMAFLCLDPEFRLTFANAMAEELMQRPRDTLLGKVIWEEFPEAMNSAFHGSGLEAMAQRNAVDLVAYYEPRDMWLELHVDPTAHGFNVYARDVTEQKDAEERSRWNIDLLQATIESTADGILVVDNEGTTLNANSRFASMWQIPSHLLATRSDHRLLAFVLDQLEEPEAFLDKVRELYGATEESFDTLAFKDGRIFERFSRALMHGDTLTGRVWSFRDTTESSRAEQGLREAEARYRTLVEQLPAVVYINAVDDVSTALYVSPQYENLLGFSEGERLRDPELWVKRLHPDDRESVLTESLRTNATGDPFLVEYRLLAKDGRVVWVRDEAVMVRDEDGNPLVWQGVLSDITERRVAEGELEKSRVLLTEAEKLAQMGSWEWDVQANELTWSEELYRIYGLDAGSVISYELFLERLHPDDRAMVQEQVEGAFATHESFGFDHRIVRPDGEVRTLRAVGRVIESSVGDIVRMFGTGQDITERKRSQEALQRSEERYRALVETAPDAVLLSSPDGTLLALNAGFEAMTGWSREEWLGKSWVPLVHPDDLPKATGMFRRLLDGGAVPVFELRLASSDTGYVLTEFAAAVQVVDGKVVGVLGVARDITERKAIETQLQESFELLRRSDEERRRLLDRVVKAQEEERGRIAGDIHDDPIQKMTAVGMRLEAFRRRIDRPEDRETLDQLEETVELSIQRLRHLMFELRPPALDREGLATALHQLLQGLAEEADLEAHLENHIVIEPDAGTRAVAYRIVQEAVTNVRKHSGAGRLEVLLETREDGLFVRITDDGAGFEAGGSDSVPGHLGMSAMRERAEFVSGWWRVESAPGEGTIVEFWLPGGPGLRGVGLAATQRT